MNRACWSCGASTFDVEFGECSRCGAHDGISLMLLSAASSVVWLLFVMALLGVLL